LPDADVFDDGLFGLEVIDDLAVFF